MIELAAGIGPWANGAFIVVFLVQLVRGLRVLYVDGTVDWKEIHVFGNASILPMVCAAAVLIIIGLVLERIPDAGPWLIHAVGIVALTGTGWSVERGTRAVRAWREEQDRIASRRAQTAEGRRL